LHAHAHGVGVSISLGWYWFFAELLPDVCFGKNLGYQYFES
jgi:hypothetical protein